MGLNLKSLVTMRHVPKALIGRESPRGLEYVAMIVAAAMDAIDIRDIFVAGAAMVLMTAAGNEIVGQSWIEPVMMVEPSDPDPVLMEVGTTPIRVSDARAQAVFMENVDAAILPPAALFRTGLVDEAADQVALAKAATAQGLDKTLEIRAELALARRRILSSAYLEMAVRQTVTEERIRAVYDEARQLADADQLIELRRIQVSSEAEAVALKRRIDQGQSFANLARRQSLDMDSRAKGGLVGSVRMSELPPAMIEAVRDLPFDTASAPVKGEQGWYLLCVDSRRAMRLPPFDEMRPQIEAQLRDEVVVDTVRLARSAVPIRLASTMRPYSGVMPTASLVASSW
ncbi:peptidyl-prolyl cis-trans isomerase [Parvularcula sp. LCG005]|uniref:peptidyl-prolyl cis-trans isomerase n=1 Tax=Parvularcula sp. LCG005 TaxID=3078805 RepID=UPI002943B0A1|nr:peptidyl-prolyl cis-trans isomerase [Parvularcula sp. LCG005]WOI52458.1 peptidyl-prolyl cis-trans isomerase [Parvularcula sp. LCG005]